MVKIEKSILQASFGWLEILVIFIIGFWLIVMRPLSPNLSQLPGDLIDTRFNNYILEHDYRWITGLDASLWDAPFFYPYPQTLTFSDSHFGSMLFYDSFRWLGLDRESAFQAWYLLSFFLTFTTVIYVLSKFKLKPLAIGIGAFFFTFGLPVLAQGGHLQLSYRFCIPLACYSFWQFFQKVQLKQLALTLFWLVWQFYLSIYLGFFLFLLLIVTAVGLTFCQEKPSIGILSYWPDILKKAWKNSKRKIQIFYLAVITLLILLLIVLFQPYVLSSKVYAFYRPWEEALKLLPRIQSYFIADFSKIWQFFPFFSSKPIPYRWEHQLFVGISTSILLILGLLWRFKSPHKKMIYLFLGAAGFLVLLTLNVNGFSFYKIFWYLPGFNSIRAMTRIILILMWPIAMFISVVADALLMTSKGIAKYSAVVILILGLMIAESGFYHYFTLSKEEAAARLQSLLMQLPSTFQDDPVLFVWNPYNNPWYLNELDAMLLSQDLGWPVMNGYSGNLPEGYGATISCDQAITRIIKYMNFENIKDPVFYNNLIPRIVVVGPGGCQWPEEGPELSLMQSSGPFSQELFSGISIKIISMTKEKNYLSIQVDVENHSSLTLPAESASGNPFRLSWRMIDADTSNPISDFDTRKDLISDIPAGGHSVLTINTIPPTKMGKYLVEISAVQELVAWFQDRGMVPVKSTLTIYVDDLNQWTISNDQFEIKTQK